MVKDVPAAPLVGEILLMTGGGPGTVRVAPLLAQPFTVISTVPVVAPLGTGIWMLDTPQVVGVTSVLFNVTVLLPCEGPKPAPLTVIVVPADAVPGDKPVITGVIRNDAAVLDTPLTITNTSTKPEPRLLGTGTPDILVALQDAGMTVTPPTVTTLLPCVLPKSAPVILIVAPTGVGGPTVGDNRVMLGDVWAPTKTAIAKTIATVEMAFLTIYLEHCMLTLERWSSVE